MAANPEAPYRIHSHPAAREALHGYIRHASSPAVRQRIISAAKQVIHSLEQQPRLFGEPRNYLPNLKLEIRVGGVEPLVFTYGVSEVQKYVVIRTIHLLSSP
jgi:hypothetical protein